MSRVTDMRECIPEILDQKHLGIFETEEEAVSAMDSFDFKKEEEKALEYAKEFFLRYKDIHFKNVKDSRTDFLSYIFNCYNDKNKDTIIHRCSNFSDEETARRIDSEFLQCHILALLEDSKDILEEYKNPYFMNHKPYIWTELFVLPVGEYNE